MIQGSSAISNIHTATVTEPNIRATLKYNSFIGDGFSGTVSNLYFSGLKSVCFNDRYVTYSNQPNQPSNYINTYDKGGSLLGTWGISATSTIDYFLQRGDFVNTGNTLDLYFLLTGSTTAGSSPTWITDVNRISSNNGLSWSGVTLMSRTIQIGSVYNTDIAMVGNSEMYLSGIGLVRLVGGMYGAVNIIQYGVVGSTTQTIYTDLYDFSNVNNCIEVFQMGDNRYLLYESGYQTTVLSRQDVFATFTLSSYPNLKLMKVGSTSIFNVTDIATTGTSIEGLHLIYGGLGGSYAYFGLEKYIREVVSYLDFSGAVTESYPDVDTTFALCKMDRDGHIYQRAFSLGGTFVSSIAIGGASSSTIQDLTLMSNNGSSTLLMYPFYETYGSSTNISENIIRYSNIDNKSITLELGNYK